MEKLIALSIISAVLICGCLGKNQTITVRDQKTGITVTGSKDEITIEGTMQLKDGTTIEIKNDEQGE